MALGADRLRGDAGLDELADLSVDIMIIIIIIIIIITGLSRCFKNTYIYIYMNTQRKMTTILVRNRRNAKTAKW